MQCFLRVDLSDESTNFKAVALTPGVALLDSGASGCLPTLRRWLGRFVAEAQWKGEHVEFFIGDGKGGRIETETCRPATPSRLKGALAKEYQDLLERAKVAVPSGNTEQAVGQWLDKAFEGSTPSGISGDGGLLYEYKDVAGNWRLVWVWGIKSNRRDGTKPMICGSSSCRELFLQAAGRPPRCTACGYLPLSKRILRPRTFLLLLLLLLLGGGLIGYMHFRPTAMIEGVVVRATDKNPTPGAEISIKGTEDQVAVDPNGRFSIGPFQPGEMTVLVTAPGYEPQEIPVTLAKDETKKLDIRLDLFGVPQGRIIASRTGKPLPDVAVRLEGETVNPVLTSAKGEFRFPTFEKEKTRIHVAVKGYQPKTVSWSRKQGALDIPLTGNSFIEGLVCDDGGTPITGAEVKLDGFDDMVLTDGGGCFRISDLPGESDCTLAVNAVGYPEIRQAVRMASEGSTPVEIVIAGKGVFMGQVIDSQTGDPITGVLVSLEGNPAEARTDDQGHFQLAGLRSGDYQLLCESEGYKPLRQSQVVTEDDAESIILSMVGAGSLTVEVVDPNLGDKPVEGAAISIVMDEKVVRQGTTTAAGTVSFESIRSDDAQIQADIPGYGEMSVSFAIKQDSPSHCRIELRGDDELVGVVRDAKTGEAIADAKLTLRFPNNNTKDIPIDEDGAFRIGGLMSGAYALEASAVGYPAAATSKVTLPGNRSDVVLELQGEVSYAGQVLEEGTEKPVVGAAISLGEGLPEITTDRDGRFQIANLREGNWAVSCRADGYLPFSQNQNLTAQADPAVISLRGNGRLAVEVINPFHDDSPVPGVNVTVTRDGEKIARATTGAEGTVTIDPIRGGPARIGIDAPGFQAVGYSPLEVPFNIAENAPSNCRIELKGTRSIEVLVQDAITQSPVALADVAVSGTGSKFKQLGTTDARGIYRLDDLIAGEYAVFAKAQGYPDMQSQKVVISETDQDIVMNLRGTSSITGRVVYANGTPGGGVTVRLVENGAERRTNEDGTFQLTELPSGNYTLTANAQDAQSSPRNCILRDREVLRLDPPIVLTRSFQMKGTVVDTLYGKPISYATVSIAGTNRTFTTDRDGNFTIDDMPEGRQQLVIKADDFYEDIVDVDAAKNTTIHTALNPDDGKTRIVLLWGELPRDIDAHLIGRDRTGKVVLHVFYKDDQNDVPNPDVVLDVDATKSNGPETMTVRDLKPGVVYEYYVHNVEPDDPGRLATSQAEVRYYDATIGKPVKFNVSPPPAQGSSDLWKVLELRRSPNGGVTMTRVGQYIQVGDSKDWQR